MSPEVARQATGADDTRLICQWQRPEAFEGWTIGPAIVVPEGDLVPLDFDEPVDNVWWFPAPQPGHATWIYVLMVEPNTPAKYFDNATPGRAFELANGEVCLLVAKERPITPEDDAWLASQRLAPEVESRLRIEPGQAFARVLTYRLDKPEDRCSLIWP